MIPLENPLKILLAPFLRPYPTCYVLSFLIFYLFFSNYSSSTSAVSPFPSEPVKDSTVFIAPWKVFLTKDLVPLAIPLPIPKGPFSNYSAGSSIKSLNPDPIFCTKETGLPKIERFPMRGRIVLKI